MISATLMKHLQKIDKNSDETKKFLSICKPLDISKFNRVCISGWNSPINPKNHVTIVEPTYYNFLICKNVNYVNKFCWKNNKTHFELRECENPDANFGIEIPLKTPNTVTIDELGDFDLLVILAINSYYESLLGATRNLKENHPVVVHSLFGSKWDEIKRLLQKFGYSKSYFVTHNENVLVCYE